MMTAGSTADDIIPPPATPTRGAFSEVVPATEFRAALAGLPTAVSIVATNGPAAMAGLSWPAVSGVSDTPATLVACVSGTTVHDIIKANGVLCITCLPAGRQDFRRRRPRADGRAPSFSRGPRAPRWRDGLVAFDCEPIKAREVSTHIVPIARVLATAQSAPATFVHHRQHYATTRFL